MSSRRFILIPVRRRFLMRGMAIMNRDMQRNRGKPLISRRSWTSR